MPPNFSCSSELTLDPASPHAARREKKTRDRHRVSGVGHVVLQNGPKHGTEPIVPLPATSSRAAAPLEDAAVPDRGSISRALTAFSMRSLPWARRREELSELGDLFVRSAHGDRHAFDRVVEYTAAPLYRVALRMLGNPADADESLQETFVRAHQALAQGQWQEGTKTYPWLLAIATRVCVDLLRRRNGRAVPYADIDANWLVSDGEQAERVHRVRELLAYLDDLPPDQRAALVLRYLEGLSNAEVAEALAISEGAVEQRLIRARANLRRRFGDDGA
jgi:RNA polymerase sigma-70 factor (ECF subfamily)